MEASDGSWLHNLLTEGWQDHLCPRMCMHSVCTIYNVTGELSCNNYLTNFIEKWWKFIFHNLRPVANIWIFTSNKQINWKKWCKNFHMKYSDSNCQGVCSKYESQRTVVRVIWPSLYCTSSSCSWKKKVMGKFSLISGEGMVKFHTVVELAKNLQDKSYYNYSLSNYLCSPSLQ